MLVMPWRHLAMAELLLRASPKRKRVGFLAFASKGGSMSLTVLPKVWRDGEARLIRTQWESNQPLSLVAYEGDVIAVDAPTSLLDALRSWLATASHSDPELLEVEQSIGRDFRAETIGGPTPGVGSLLDMVELFDRCQLSLVDEQIPTGGDRHILLRLIAYRRFVSEVEPLLNRLRAHYVETDEWLLSPKGRILDSSFAVTLATRQPRVLCRFDEHSTATDLAKVLLAALHVVARYPGTQETNELFRPIQSRAVRLVRGLEAVPIIDRRIAFRLSRSIRLSRYERTFRSPLQVARTILIDDPRTPAPPTPDDTPGFVLSIPTDKLWEKLVGDALLRSPRVSTLRINADNRAGGPDVEVPAPWHSANGTETSDRYPDYLARLTTGGVDAVWCLDAKYKDEPRNLPQAEDSNQIFAYGHLAHLGGSAVDRCALIYPANGQGRVVRELVRQRDGQMRLTLIALPYPQPSDTASDLAWDDFQRAAGESLTASLG
ncbi:MAG: uncharacterized protein JWN46_1985 [Acidimicrobiales bacterium]|nr:uncharacterized protein [Acidimicrobiales bacterium]